MWIWKLLVIDRERTQGTRPFLRVFTFFWFESFLRRPEIVSLLDTQVDGPSSAMNALKGYRKVLENNSKSKISYSEGFIQRNPLQGLLLLRAPRGWLNAISL